MHRIMCCRHCDSIATSFPIIPTNGLWSVMTCPSCVNSSIVTPLANTDPKDFSLDILLYCCSLLDRLLLANAMSQSIPLSDTLIYLQLMSSLTCGNVAPRPTPDASLPKYNGFLTSYYFIHVSSFTSNLAFVHLLV